MKHNSIKLLATMSDLAYRNIAEKIAARQLVPGQKVSQLKLAKEFKCSTIPVVEAMRRLESEGLLVKDGRKMARVRKLTAAEIEGLYLIREGLESVAARRCIERITDEQIARLRKLTLLYEEAELRMDMSAIQKVEREFHQLIVNAAGSPMLSQEFNRLFLIEQTVGSSLPVPDHVHFHSSHRALIEAIADRDADSAEYFMKKHIRHGCQEFQENLKKAGKSKRSGKRGRPRHTA
jgi:DNA-binding GntR family transcriptional regulator